MKAGGVLLISGYDDIGQHVGPTNIPGPQESTIDIIYVLGSDVVASYMNTTKEDN